MTFKCFAVIVTILIMSALISCNEIIESNIISKNKVKLATKAIASLIDSLSDQYSIRFQVVRIGNDRVLKYLQQKICEKSKSPVVLNKLKIGYTIIPGSEFSQIILTKSPNDIEFMPTVDYSNTIIVNQLQKFEKKEVILIYDYKNATIRDYYVKTNFTNIWNGLSFLSLSTDKSKLMYITQQQCPRGYSTSNEYDLRTMKWNSTNYFRIFHRSVRCVFYAYFDDRGIETILGHVLTEHQNLIFSGTYGGIVQMFADANNIKFRVFGSYNDGMLPDIALMPYETKEHPTQTLTLHRTLPINFFHSHFVITKGLLYSPYEKLILPFDLPTWILIILTFLIGFLTILALYFWPIEMQNFVFGLYNQQPSLNLLHIFFGLGVIKVKYQLVHRLLRFVV